jgi:D-alanyl-D-alanine carboxypeptidase (penicillin-binding protein 5/6)
VSLRLRFWCALPALLTAALLVAMPLGGEARAETPSAPPKVAAASVFVVNADTGQTLYAKNPDKGYHILSLTKLITGYVLVQRLGAQLADTIAIKQAHLRPGSTSGLRKDDIWTLQDLLYGAMLVSGNDASVAIADHVGGAMLAAEGKKGDPTTRFVQEMRSEAAALGAKQTKFADPYGLSPSNISTAREVGVMAATIFRDARILPAWQCTERRLAIGGPNARSVTLKSTIEILGEDGIVAGKTGSHAGNKMFNLAVGWLAPNGQTIAIVVIGSPSNAARYKDTRAIIAALPRDFPELAAPAGHAAVAARPCP